MRIIERMEELLKEMFEQDVKDFDFKKLQEHCESIVFLHNGKTAIECLETIRHTDKAIDVQLDRTSTTYVPSVVKCIVCQKGDIVDGLCTNRECKLNSGDFDHVS